MADTDVQAKLDELERIKAGNRARSKRFFERVKQNGRKQISTIVSGESYDQLCQIRDTAKLAGNPTSFGQIIEQALAFYADSLKPINDNKSVDIDDNVEQNQKAEQDNTNDIEGVNINDDIEPGQGTIDEPTPEAEITPPAVEPPGAMPDQSKEPESTDKPIQEIQTEVPGPTPDKKGIIEIMKKYRDNGDSWQTVVDKLNDQGILTARGGTWTKANAPAFYCRNKEA